MKTKSLKAVDAAKWLPESCLDAFMRAWNLCDCADIYDGELRLYMEVIGDRIAEQDRTISALKERLDAIRTACDP